MKMAPLPELPCLKLGESTEAISWRKDMTLNPKNKDSLNQTPVTLNPLTWIVAGAMRENGVMSPVNQMVMGQKKTKLEWVELNPT